MKIKLIRSYRSKNGNATFVYGVSGSNADLDAFKEAQGDYFATAINSGTLGFEDPGELQFHLGIAPFP